MPANQSNAVVTAKITLNSGLKAPVFDITGAQKTTIDLAKEVFGSAVNTKLLAQAVKVYLANQRQGSASTKTRSEVSGSTRKIYQQKHTGNARHGGIRAPLFVHGGIAHGPRPHDFSLALPEKMRKAALKSALSAKTNDSLVGILEDLNKLTPKTKAAAAMFGKMGFGEKRNVLIVLDTDNAVIYRTLRNITGIEVTTAGRLSTYPVLAKKHVLFMAEALPVLVERLTK